MTGLALVSERVRSLALQVPSGAAWLAGLPHRVAELEERWSLELGPPFAHDGYTAVVLPARREDGTAAVLKLTFPHMEGRDEAAGLLFWDGDGAVRLLEQADEGRAMLLERCVPGHDLRDLQAGEQMRLLAGLARRLWRRPPDGDSFRPLAEMISYWSEETLRDEARWPDPALVREGLAAWAELSRPRPDDVLLATDLHAGNVLSAEREPWLVIDPKPFLGDPAYDATQHLFDLQERLSADPVPLIGLFADLLEVPRDRARAWLFARFAAERRDDDESWARANDVARRLAPG